MSVKKADRTESVFEAISHAIYMRGYYKFISKESLYNLNNLYNQLFIYPFIKTQKEGLILLF